MNYFELICMSCGKVLAITKEKRNIGDEAPASLFIFTSNVKREYFDLESPVCKCGGPCKIDIVVYK